MKSCKFFGVIVLTAVIAFSMAACSNGTTDPGGGVTPSTPSTPIEPSNIAVTGVTLKAFTYILVDDIETLKATITPANATNQNVTWRSSNSAVATVSSSGKVTAIAKGTATITVTTVDGGKMASCTVTVADESVPVTGVSLNKTSISLNVGGAENLSASIMPSNATNQNVTWSSSDTSVATVSDGTVTAVAAGSATITVTTVDGSKTASSNVTVTSGTLAAPTNISAPAVTSTSITVSWSSVTGATGYKVYRSTSSSDTYSSVGNVTTTSYTDTGLTVNTTYYYKVSAYNNAGESSQSSSVSAATSSTFVAVTGITGVPSTASVGSLTLSGTVEPSNATNKTIAWSVKTPGTTGATISGNTLTTTAAGTVTVTGTIANGKAVGTPYTQDFSITVNGSNPGGSGNVTSWTVYDNDTWVAAVNGIRTGGNNKAYTITFTADVAVSVAPNGENTFGSVTDVTIIMEGNHTITRGTGGTAGYSTLLRIGYGQTLIVNNLKLQGSQIIIGGGGLFRMQGGALVTGYDWVGNGGYQAAVLVGLGTFIMQDNASVLNNNFGGVYSGGTFTMQGNASVSGNKHYGGVTVYGGTFTMQDNASVSGNSEDILGGGVYIIGGTFTMQDNASVSGNTAAAGGGVAINDNRGTLMMMSGEIAGNSSTSGGGVYLFKGGTFTKTGGTIYGNDAVEGLKNTASYGHAAMNEGTRTYRNATAGPNMNTDNLLFWSE